MKYKLLPPYVIGGNQPPPPYETKDLIYHTGGEHNHKLTKMEEKYCSCLMHVRSKTGNPYGICTKSVYGDVKRDKIVDCDVHYDYKKYSKNELEALGKEKKMNTKMSRNKLISKLENRQRYIIKKY